MFGIYSAHKTLCYSSIGASQSTEEQLWPKEHLFYLTHRAQSKVFDSREIYCLSFMLQLIKALTS